MNVLQLVKDMNENINDAGRREIVLEQFSVWNNNACVGYVIKALESVDIPVADKEKVIEALESIIDEYTVEEAEEIALGKGRL